MEQESSLKEFLLMFIRGLFIGTANILPGVSGGTIALITGIYERLIVAISDVDIKLPFYIIRGDLEKTRKGIKEIDFDLFIPLLLGVLISFLALSRVMESLLEDFTSPAYGFFLGLILASSIFTYRYYINGINRENLLFVAMGFIAAFLILNVSGLQANHSLPIIFLSGALVLCAMILPGISGAFILLLMNQYAYMLHILNQMKFLEIFVFVLGALVGIMAFSRILRYLINNYESLTMSFLIGLMLGSLKLLYEEIVRSMISLPVIFISALVGFVIVFVLESRF